MEVQPTVFSPEAENEFDLGVASYEQAEYAQALRHFHQAAVLSPRWAPAWANVGECNVVLRAYDDAIVAYRNALRIAPQFAQACLGLGVSLHRLGKHTAARRQVRRAVELAPNHWKSWACLAEILLATGEPQQAVAAAEKATRVEAGCGDAHFVLGKARLQAGLVAEAVAAFRDATILEPASSEAWHNLGVCNFRAGDIEAALRHQCEALAKVHIGHETNRGPRQGLDPQKSHRALLALKQALDLAGIPFFLVFGTLLGVIRENDLLKHDKDIDVGIFDDVNSTELAKALATDRAFSYDPDFRPQDRYFTVYHEGFPIDFFRHCNTGSKVQCGFNERDGGVQWSFTAFSLAEHRFLDVTFLVPSDPEQYLREMYGSNWRVPAVNYNPIVSSPARVLGSADTGGLYLTYNKIYMAITRNENRLAFEWLDQILRHRDLPDELRSLHQTLASQCRESGDPDS